MDARADLYALCAVGYWLLMGTHLFNGKLLATRTARALAASDPPWISMPTPLGARDIGEPQRAADSSPISQQSSVMHMNCADSILRDPHAHRLPRKKMPPPCLTPARSWPRERT